MPISEGRFVWHDLATTDVDGARTFYGAIAPWTSKAWDDDGEYFLWEREGKAVGGVSRLTASDGQSSRPPAWMPSVYVYDVDACVRRVPKLGGRVLLAPREIPDVGCWAMIAGPDGAPLGIFEPSQGAPHGHDGKPGVGEFTWHELAAPDWRESWKFYSQLFHWETVEEHDLGENGIYFVFGLKGVSLGGMWSTGGQFPSEWTSYVAVPSVNAAIEQVRAHGGKVVREPHAVPDGTWIAHCADPQGATFAITSATA
jgi:predicted enzyme related to lactoylglutathione lyase